MFPYVQHARRHLPGGTDPLPLGFSFCNVDTHNTTITLLATGTPMDQFDLVTNDTDTFGQDTVTIAGTAYKGIVLKKAGVYLLWTGCAWQSAGAGAHVHFGTRVWNAGRDGPYVGREDAVADTTPTAGIAQFGFMNSVEVDQPDVPASPHIVEIRNDTNATGSAVASLFYVYLGPGTIF